MCASRDFKYQVFLSRSAKERTVVCAVSERLKQAGRRHPDSGLQISVSGFLPQAAEPDAAVGWSRLKLVVFQELLGEGDITAQLGGGTCHIAIQQTSVFTSTPGDRYCEITPGH
jgi:hypothetical protein